MGLRGPTSAQMGTSLARAILELAEQAGSQGAAMGAIVDALEGRGLAVSDIEHEIWTLMSQRRLTPSGFICRALRRQGNKGATKRAYEFLLVPWSPELDGQLELKLK